MNSKQICVKAPGHELAGLGAGSGEGYTQY